MLQRTADVKIKGFAGKMTIWTNTGDITVKRCILHRSRITSNTGDINFVDNKVCGKVDVRTDTGDIKVSVKGEQGRYSELSVKTATGDICFLNDNFYISKKQTNMWEQGHLPKLTAVP